MKRLQLIIPLLLVVIVSFADIVDYLEGLEIPAWKADGTTLLIDHATQSDGKQLRTYAIEYDRNANHSRWVAFKFDAATRGGNASRSNDFDDDPDLPAENRIGSSAFDTGYDRGHLCASNDRRYSDEANAQTFYMSNMSPQMTRFNEYYWKSIESRVQKLGNDSTFATNLYVVKGGTIDNPLGVMARTKNSTIIPSHYFIALLQECIDVNGNKGYRALGFYVPHTNCEDINSANLVPTIQSQVCSIDFLEEQTGIDFFPNLPDDVEFLVESKEVTNSVLYDWGFDVSPDYHSDPNTLVYHEDSLRYDITLIDKGETYKTLRLPFGENIYLATASEVPVSADGYAFAGWATSQRLDSPDFLTRREIASKADTLYAIYKTSVEGYIYNKVLTDLDDWSGDYLIACDEAKIIFDGALDSLDVSRNFYQLDTIIGTSIPSNKVTDARRFTFSRFSGGYSICNRAGKYINRSIDANGLEATDYPTPNTITFSGGNVNIKGEGSFLLQYYPVVTIGGQRFRYYNNTQKPIQLYRRAIGTTDVYGLGTARSRTVTITQALWATYCCEFETVIPDGVEAYYATVSGDIVELHRIESSIVPAGVGVLLHASEPGKRSFVESHTSAVDFEGNCLVGVIRDEAIGGNGTDYILTEQSSAVTFVRARASILPAGKCYLKTDGTSAAKIHVMLPSGITPAIAETDRPSANSNTSYNLQGQKVDQSYRGIVIRRGKAYIQ